jgi:nitrogen fixation NifU-like protein
MNAVNPEAANRMPLEDLYQEVILDHNRRPRNFKAIENSTASCHGHNPLCGDDYDIYVRTVPADGGARIEDIGFTGKGCAISKASGSMMTAKVKGKSLSEARGIKDAFLDLVTRDTPAAGASGTEALLGSLNIFLGVKKYPIRVKCATLVWRALEEALDRAESSTSSGGPS